MLDRDLAELYGVQTRVLKQAVKRNIERFPKDFMFEMTGDEFQYWRSQFVISNISDKMGLRRPPFCFTEQGVAMLSSVLSSAQAIEVNISIIRIFTKMRQVLSTQKDILLKLEQLERKMSTNDNDIQLIFSALKLLLHTPSPSRKKSGFKRYDG
jgi:limonene-1,2-epoxide hydrolase